MAAKKKAEPWEREPPKDAHHHTLSTAEKAKARGRARRAGRRYPNLVDNMAVAREQDEPRAKKSSARKASAKKSSAKKTSARKASAKKASTKKASGRKSSVKSSAKRSAPGTSSRRKASKKRR